VKHRGKVSPRRSSSAALDTTDEALVRQAIDYARFPLAPRLDPPKAILAKLEPPAALVDAAGHGAEGRARPR
jgi:hypothetical protein